MIKIKPANKNPGIDEFAQKINPTGKNRIDSINGMECATCNNTNLKFRNELSIKEYSISGMCQECQDNIFGID